MSTTLPSTRALQAFISVATSGSLRAAANVLHVTPAAVSLRLHALERHLGCALFDRTAAGLVLNSSGQTYLAEVMPLLAALKRAGEGIGPARCDHILRVVSEATFHTYWLAPSLSGFTRHHPGVDIELLAPSQVEDRAADVSIRLSHAPRPASGAVRLFDLIALPVCATQLAADAMLRQPSDLKRMTLINSPQTVDLWHLWLQRAGLKASDHKWMMVDSHQSALEMLRRRLGVCLTANFLAHRMMTEIVTPIALTCSTPGGMDLMLPIESERKLTRDFCDWVIAEARACQPHLIV